MGYYCTVPQCTSLAGKTKNVKFHRFPRDVTMADKWNIILKRGKPYTKYSKVCSLHFTQSDYNVTTMGQWKTLSKDAVPSQNLPKLNPDGTVMVIRKSRTVKYKESRKEEHISDKADKWCLPLAHSLPHAASDLLHHEQENNLSYRLQTLSAIASSLPAAAAPIAPAAHQTHSKPKKQDAFMQTDPVQSEEDDTQPNNSYSEPSEASASPSFNAEAEYQQYKDSKDYQKEYQKFQDEKKYETPKDFSKNDEYMPQTNEEYNKEAEKYALERKSHNSYEKLEPSNTSTPYPKLDNGYQKLPDMYGYEKEYHRPEYQGIGYQSHSDGRYDSVEMLRSQQHNIQALQEQHRLMENQNFFNESPIKQEVDLIDDDKYMYERTKEQLDASLYSRAPRPLPQVKQEPDVSGGDTAMHSQDSAYYTNGHSNVSAGPLVTDGAYYAPRPGPEMLIAKQNALAAHSQLWQNTMKRPFFYGDSPHYSGPQLLHRYTSEDLPRMLQ